MNRDSLGEVMVDSCECRIRGWRNRIWVGRMIDIVLHVWRSSASGPTMKCIIVISVMVFGFPICQKVILVAVITIIMLLLLLFVAPHQCPCQVNDG